MHHIVIEMQKQHSTIIPSPRLPSSSINLLAKSRSAKLALPAHKPQGERRLMQPVSVLLFATPTMQRIRMHMREYRASPPACY
jgi:hypothetical protein